MVVEAFELIVRDFAIIMIIATVMALVSHRLKQPMVIAYIIAGMIIGPYTPPSVSFQKLILYSFSQKLALSCYCL